MISVINFFPNFFFITRVLYICQKGKSESRGTQEYRARPRVACAPPWITAFQKRERKTHIRFLSRLPDVVRSAELTDMPLRRSVHAWWGKFSRGPVLILASLSGGAPHAPASPSNLSLAQRAFRRQGDRATLRRLP